MVCRVYYVGLACFWGLGLPWWRNGSRLLYDTYEGNSNITVLNVFITVESVACVLLDKCVDYVRK